MMFRKVILVVTLVMTSLGSGAAASTGAPNDEDVITSSEQEALMEKYGADFWIESHEVELSPSGPDVGIFADYAWYRGSSYVKSQHDDWSRYYYGSAYAACNTYNGQSVVWARITYTGGPAGPLSRTSTNRTIASLTYQDNPLPSGSKTKVNYNFGYGPAGSC